MLCLLNANFVLFFLFSEFRRGKELHPFITFVLFIVVLGVDIGNEVLEENDMILKQVEGQHQAGNCTEVFFDNSDFLHDFKQEINLLDLKSQDLLLPLEVLS